jgi:co-chaperonin GroES (HSP10)
MKATRGRIIVKSVASDGLVKRGSLFIVTYFQPEQFDELLLGEVIGISDEEEEIKVGDTVMVHHNAFKKNNLISASEDIYNLHKDPMIYCYIRDDKMEMVSDYVFVEPQLDDKTITDAGIYLPYMKGRKKSQVGILRNIGKRTEDVGDAEVGDTIVYQKLADYELKVKGKTMFRMKQDRILAKVV